MKTVNDVINDKTILNGQTISFKGFLAANFEEAFIYESEKDLQSKIKIDIIDDDFITNCLKKIPSYVGGHYIYYDYATITGTVKITSDDKISIDRVKTIKIERDGISYDNVFE